MDAWLESLNRREDAQQVRIAARAAARHGFATDADRMYACADKIEQGE